MIYHSEDLLGKDIWNGGTSPMKVPYGKLMMWFFLVSDAFTFTTLLVSYGMIRSSHPQYPLHEDFAGDFIASQDYWPIPDKVFDAFPFFHGFHLPLIFVGLMTFILILSSVTMVLAVDAGNRMDKESVKIWMVWTILGGIAFLSCQAWEWGHFISGSEEGVLVKKIIDGEWMQQRIHGANLFVNEYGPSDFAALFFFITGFHGMHVFSGVILNILVLYNATIGVYEKLGHYNMVEKIGLYWHFVDLVWVFVFTFFYLI